MSRHSKTYVLCTCVSSVVCCAIQEGISAVLGDVRAQMAFSLSALLPWLCAHFRGSHHSPMAAVCIAVLALSAIFRICYLCMCTFPGLCIFLHATFSLCFMGMGMQYLPTRRTCCSWTH